TDTDAYGLVRAGGVDAGGQGTPVGEDLQCGVVDKDAQVDPPVGARRDLSVPGFSVGRRVEAAGLAVQTESARSVVRPAHLHDRAFRAVRCLTDDEPGGRSGSETQGRLDVQLVPVHSV